MNKKGFTLAELVAVIALIALITIIALPNVRNLQNKNKDEEYKIYKDMMVEYAKTNYKYKSGTDTYICLKDLNINDIKINNIKNNVDCVGYVDITGNKLTPYLRCMQNGNLVYPDQTNNNFSIPDDCGDDQNGN